jgi:protein SCO1/2
VAFVAALLAAVVAAGLVVWSARRGHETGVQAEAPPATAVASWPAGQRPAPSFTLVDQHGTAFSLRSLRGRPVVITFIDPLCRSLCPLEAKILMKAVRAVPAARRPTVVAVSVNPWGNTPSAFAADASHWQLGSGWRWGVGSRERLARVWRAYGIDVQFVRRKLAGVTIRDVVHTEAAYLVDATGHERALFVYPFAATDVATALRHLS